MGAAVIDVSYMVEALPQWGRATQASEGKIIAGGKGLNQAMASANLGASVTMISAVGDDESGQALVAELNQKGVSTDHVLQLVAESTPTCSVFVSRDGDAAFVAVKSTRVTVDQVRGAADSIAQADALLVTLEEPLDAVEAAVALARQHDVPVYLNPAPPANPEERVTHLLLRDVDYLIPNLWEAQCLLGYPPGTGRRTPDAEQLASQLHDQGVRQATCVTTSSLGCAVATTHGSHSFHGFPSRPVDTTGGSDAFCATLAVALARGDPFEDGVQLANAAGAIAVGRWGGSSSMPTGMEEVEGFVAGARGDRRRRGAQSS
jgi:ribokinase